MKIENSTNFIKENNINVFRHQAMNTIFELYLSFPDNVYCSQAANEAFKLIDSLENKLSRFLPNSEVNKINNLQINSSLVISEDTFNCLLESKNIYELTFGGFNIGIGNTIDFFKYDNRNLIPHHSTSVKDLLIDESNHSITVLNKISIDLGGIAKGYTAERISELLNEWGIENYLINCGMSTILVQNSNQKSINWPIRISNPFNGSLITELNISKWSISSSGLIKGEHIINPFNNNPVNVKKASWTYCPSAVLSDSLSTSFMILKEAEIENICHNNNVSCLIYFKDEGGNNLVKKYGNYFNINDYNSS